jgi:hypothetical protein
VPPSEGGNPPLQILVGISTYDRNRPQHKTIEWAESWHGTRMATDNRLHIRKFGPADFRHTHGFRT